MEGRESTPHPTAGGENISYLVSSSPAQQKFSNPVRKVRGRGHLVTQTQTKQCGHSRGYSCSCNSSAHRALHQVDCVEEMAQPIGRRLLGSMRDMSMVGRPDED